MGLVLSKETDQAIGAFFTRARQSLDALDQTVTETRATVAALRQVLKVAHAELLAVRALRTDLPLTVARAIADALEARHAADTPHA